MIGPMQIDPENLPDDPALQQLLRTVLHRHGELNAENDKLRPLIQRLTRHQFGRCSEQLTDEQLQLGLEDLEQTIAENQAAQDAAEPAIGSKPKPRSERLARNHGALPAHLPRYEVVIDVAPEASATCCGSMHCIGELRTEQLDIVPAQLWVRVTRRANYACRSCAQSMVVAAAPAERSRPIVDALYAWMQAQLPRIPGALDLAKAIRYAIRHWPGLCAFLDDGRIEMDTNVVERAIRPITLNCKNALFAGSDGGARHWAIAMTFIQTLKLNGVEPMEWLTDVLERIVFGRTKSHELESLLPWNWQPSKATSTGKHPALAA